MVTKMESGSSQRKENTPFPDNSSEIPWEESHGLYLGHMSVLGLIIESRRQDMLMT
jgi:hypothetical protein